ncbi:uncharacterized protein LOC62_03G004255 [Vanrija pseudolonga]|uniref:Glycoprotein n=1 Tax=Vanrija pseudolonga TaxID=143232 RepID=A0AAF0Y9Q1_9TREE|nr:hypothetical protein LOC62_03G004255 [Vanrija pseudolonga]
MWSLVAPATAALLAASAANAQAGVVAHNPNGPTNPDKPEFYPVGAQVNQTSLSRLLSLNGVDDFCLFGPMEPGPDSLIGNTEPTVVSWCTKPRNNARRPVGIGSIGRSPLCRVTLDGFSFVFTVLIPDGAIHAAHVIKTPAYVQIYGFWDGTKVNIPAGDSGGELDPHGAENLGNPIGGNVTSNIVDGKTDVFYEEWMSFIGFDQFCLRICTAETAGVPASLMCEHQLDIMGCRFVMAIEDFYSSNNTFTFCEGENAAPPGLYPQPDGSTSTFRQRYTDSLSRFTVGNTVTPTGPAFWPKTSNCITYSTISNGVDFKNLMVTAAPTLLVGQSSSVAAVGTTSQAVVTTPTAVPTFPPSGAAASSGVSASGDKAASGAGASASAGASAGASSKPSGAKPLVGSAGLIASTVAVIGVVVGAVAVF